MFIYKSVKSETRQYKYKITQTLRISSHSDAFSFTFRDNLYYLYMINVLLFLVGCLGFPCPSVLCLFVCVCTVEDAGLSIVVVPLAVRLSVGMAAWCLFNLSQSYSITPNPIPSLPILFNLSSPVSVYSWCRSVMCVSLYIFLSLVFFFII